MILKKRLRLIRTVIFSLTAAILLPLGVYAQTDVPVTSVSDDQVIYEYDVFSDDLVGQSGTGLERGVESGAKAAIHEALLQHADRVDLSAYRLTYDEARALLRDVIYWDGSLFYAEPLSSATLRNGYVVYLYPRYIEHEAEVEKALKKVIRESITPDMSDLQKMLALHNWLAENCRYDYTYEKYTAYDALVTGSSVCQGYMEAYAMLLRYIGILEVGSAHGGNHTWNQVKVDGQWYNIDVTWDSNYIENASFGQMYYGNFLISDSQLIKNHTIESQDHECTSTLYDRGGWWNAGGKTVGSAALPIDGAGSYRLGYDRPNMSLIYRAEATGAEKVVHVFDNASWGYRDGSYGYYYPNCYGVLIRTGRTTFVNDAKSVYRITDDGNISVIYTYTGEDGRNIFGMRERHGNLEIQIGYKPTVSEAEIRTISLEPYIEEDPETRSIKDFIRRMYRITLEREADADGLDFYVTKLQSGEMDGSAVAQGFVGSPEFQGKNLSQDDYLAALYSAFFDRTAGPEEIQYWKNEMASGMSRKYVLRGFVNSREFDDLCRAAGITRGEMVLAESEMYEVNEEKLGEFVERLYVKALGRDSEPEGKKYWIAQIASREVTAEEAAKKFFFSPEFESFHTGNAEYIARLYETFMGRAAEPAGMEYWLNEMSRGMSREVVLSRFAASNEFREIMESFGLR